MEWIGQPRVAGSTPRMQYIMITLAVFGLQFVWSLEQAYVSMYLLDLGISKELLSLVWVAGPLCGLIVQPIVGVFSDFSTNIHGRRRPFMVWGALVTACGLALFGWAREMDHLLPKPLNAVNIAILALLIVDISVNVCQAAARALIVDMFSARRQASANAWASRMAAGGHLASYSLSALDLTKLGLGSQLKGACAVSIAMLLVCVSISATAVKERALVSPIVRDIEREVEHESELSALYRLKERVSQFRDTAVKLDPQLRAVFKVQLLAWYSWFTFLFYGSTYAGEVWRNHQPTGGVDDMARAGSLALTVFSVSSTIFTIILPKLKIKINNIWVLSLVVYSLAVLSTKFATSLKQVLGIFGVVGFSWAATLWIPYALTAERIHQLPLSELPEIEVNSPEDELVIPDTGSSLSSASLGGHEEQTGIILGLHNSALTLPQFVSAFCSFLIFNVVDDQSAVAVTLQVGAIPALLAAFYASKTSRI